MTIEEEINLLDDAVRRLKVEYDIYFGGGSKKPPTDLEWRVQSLLKKHSDGKLTFQQRFRYNSIAQKYAVFSDLWRQKLKVKEEGFRRPQDVLLGVQGLRTGKVQEKDAPTKISVLDEGEDKNIKALFDVMSRERSRAGLPSMGTMESFARFVRGKTTKIKEQFGCAAVEYSVELEDGKVKLKARAK